jgi:hypothetical protein
LVYAAATRLGLRCLILSGEYRILAPSDPIPYYDHLLLLSEFPEQAKLMADQLKELDLKDMIFFTRSDSTVEPYRECMKSASEIAGVALKLVYLPTANA